MLSVKDKIKNKKWKERKNKTRNVAERAETLTLSRDRDIRGLVYDVSNDVSKTINNSEF